MPQKTDMRQPIIAANWKMNKVISEALDFAAGLKKQSPGKAEIVLAPPFTALSAVKNLLNGSQIGLAGQNVCSESKGAYTGEISAAMLKDAGCDYVIIGHSERRKYFHEDDALINKKIKMALTCGLKVIFCVGETLEQREKDETREVIRNQVEKGLSGLEASGLRDLVIAYEPVWAIGTGKTATPEQAQEVHRFMRERIQRLFGDKAASAMRIQYGGSVTPENSGSLLAQPDIDGALVGGASLAVESFCAIIKSIN